MLEPSYASANVLKPKTVLKGHENNGISSVRQADKSKMPTLSRARVRLI